MKCADWNYTTLIEYSAGFYLAGSMPRDWDGMDDRQLLHELEERAWQPFENMDGEYLWQQIESMAMSLNETFKLGVKNL